MCLRFTRDMFHTVQMHSTEHILCTTQGIRRPVIFLRDSGSLQSLVFLKPGDFVDTGENRLIQGILGNPSEIPLIEIDLENDQISGRFLCGLVDYLPRG